MNYKYYSLKNILAKKAQYNVIIGERSNGKTYALLEYGLKKFCQKGETMAIIRRWKEDFRGKRGKVMFDALVSNGLIEKYTGGQFSGVAYYNGQWFLSYIDEKTNTVIKDATPFCYGFSLNDMEHDKSTSYPTVTTIVFDEFLTRSYYIPDEFVIFMNVLSTIIRQRNNVTIFMLGNTVNKFCPYFDEMGLTHITKMKQGTIDVYQYGDSNLRVAVEYCANIKKSKSSDVYFAFNNPKLQMIKNGSWELGLYNHLMIKYKPSDIQLYFFIYFDGKLIQGEVITKSNDMFVFCHRKTTPLKEKSTDIIYSYEASIKPNHRLSFTYPIDKIDSTILQLYRTGKFFYQSNDVGEIVNNYLKNVKAVQL